MAGSTTSNGDVGSRAGLTTAGHVSPVSTRTGATIAAGHPHLTAAQLRLVQREMSLLSNVTNVTNFSARISKPMFRKDIFYTGSIENLDEFKKKVNVFWSLYVFTYWRLK